MRKTLDQTFDLTEDGLSACYRLRLYEPEVSEIEASESPERVLVATWVLHEPGQPLEKWTEQMADSTFSVFHEQGGQLLLIEFYPRREYRMGENLVIFEEEISMARIQPLTDGTLALLDFGEMAREEVEARIGESLTETEVTP